MSIKVVNLTKKYGDFIAVNNVSFEIEDGKMYCLFGDSGSGKTTLLKMISGLLSPTDGEINYNNKSIYDFTKKELCIHRNQNIGFVFQDYFLEEKLTVFENVSVPLLIKGKINKINLEKLVEESLQKVGIATKKNQIVSSLSGGERQRVSIARAIVSNPKIVFADEPTGNLDTFNSNKIMEIFNNLNTNGTTIFLVTHNNSIFNSIENKIIIKDGIIGGDK